MRLTSTSPTILRPFFSRGSTTRVGSRSSTETARRARASTYVRAGGNAREKMPVRVRKMARDSAPLRRRGRTCVPPVTASSEPPRRATRMQARTQNSCRPSSRPHPASGRYEKKRVLSTNLGERRGPRSSSASRSARPTPHQKGSLTATIPPGLTSGSQSLRSSRTSSYSCDPSMKIRSRGSAPNCFRASREVARMRRTTDSTPTLLRFVRSCWNRSSSCGSIAYSVPPLARASRAWAAAIVERPLDDPISTTVMGRSGDRLWMLW